MFGLLKGRKELCPYCFEHFSLRDAPFRCSAPAKRCAPEKDDVLDEAWEIDVPLGKVVAPAGRGQRGVRCPDCNQLTHKRLCPHCHQDLPPTIGDQRSFIFAIIGGPQSGKSHYIAVLIDRIRKHIGPSLDLLLEPLNDQTINRYKTEFYEPVFRKGIVINKTHQAEDRRASDVWQPMVYSLTISERKRGGGTKIKSVVTLVFFDTAGEDLNSDDTMARVNKYIYRSDGLIVLVDPLQLDTVRDRLGAGVGLPDAVMDTAEVLNRATRLIENGRDLRGNHVIKTPLAVAFSKFDAVTPLIDPQFQLLAPSSHERGFDVGDFEAVNSEMMALLEEWDSQDLLQLVQTRYKRAGFFGFSALGCNPHLDDLIPRVLPQRVEDPFLWLLAEHKLIARL
jgi:hypothetical protein